jgi:hypothetical protein
MIFINGSSGGKSGRIGSASKGNCKEFPNLPLACDTQINVGDGLKTKTGFWALDMIQCFDS